MAKVAINLATGALQQEEIIVGIDLGTTNSLVAYVHPETRQPLAINDQGRGSIVPSVVHFPADGHDPVVGTDAKEYLLTDPQRTIYSVKRLLGKSYRDLGPHAGQLGYRVIDDNAEGLVKIRVADRFYSPIELSADILKELRARAEHALKTPVNRAVITVPAYFNDSQRQATRDAGRLAGLEVLRIVNEPTAAALAYGIGLSPDEEKTVAVYDLGGGTFDVSILRIQQGIFEVLSTNGDTYLGGDDFDRAIAEHWQATAGLPAAFATDPHLQQQLRLAAEMAKRYLSQHDDFTTQLTDAAGAVFPVALTKAKFNELVGPLVARTIAACRQAMADAGIPFGEQSASTNSAPSTGPQAPSTGPQAPSSEPGAPSSGSQAPGSEPQAPSSEPRVPGSEARAPSSEPRVPGSEARAPSSEPGAPSSEPRAPGSEARAPGSGPQAPGPKVDAVLLVGGSTRVPLVFDEVSKFFGQPANNSLNPDEVVALGAAIQADILAGNRRDVLLLDVTPLTLGIETLGGLLDPIIPRNSKIPTKAGRQYTTSIDGQVNLKIGVYQGERDLVSQNRKLGEFVLSGIPAMPAGLPKVDVNFLLNADGILQVEAIELRSNTRQRVEIKPQYGLTDEQVEQMLMDSLLNAKDDVAARLLIEARTAAEQLLYQVENFTRKNRVYLTEEELSDTGAQVARVRAALAGTGRDPILKSMDELDELTRPYAERVMNISIQQAMAGKKLG